MPRIVLLLIALLVIFTVSVTYEEDADLQKGLDAAYSGDFDTALRELKPLAEQGNAKAQYSL